MVSKGWAKLNAAKHPAKRSFVFFLVPDFTMIAFATALEPLRSANRMLGYDAYKWRLASMDGRPVKASNGVECAVNTSLDEERRKMAGPERPVDGRSSAAASTSRATRTTVRRSPGCARSTIAASPSAAFAPARMCWPRRVCFQQTLRHPLGKPARLLRGLSRRPMCFADLFEVDQNIYTPAPAAPRHST